MLAMFRYHRGIFDVRAEVAGRCGDRFMERHIGILLWHMGTICPCIIKEKLQRSLGRPARNNRHNKVLVVEAAHGSEDDQERLESF